MSKTPEHIRQKIREAKEKYLKELDLTGSSKWEERLTEIPAEVFELEQLEVLNLESNRLTSIPDGIARLSNLTSLNVSNNQLTTLPDAIGNLSNLTSLDISLNQLTTLPDAIGQLVNLELLDLSGNRLTILPDAIAELHNLTSFYLGYNSLVSIPDIIYKLFSLKHLALGRVGSPLERVKFLLILKSRKRYQDKEFVKEKNQIKEISPKILQLKNLKELNLGGNPIEIPPPEVVKKGVGAIKDYFRQKEAEGVDYLCEAKLLIVGEAGAGKTTLAKKIEDPNYQLRENEESTEGIDVIQWEFPLPSDLSGSRNLKGLKKKFRVNIWDFGGQDIYHATHQFFLTKRSLYALVADTRKEDTDFYYWLNVVELLSDNSPLLIIKNEKQDRHWEINEHQLRGQFTNLEKTLATNLATNRGLNNILDQIKHYISHLPHVGTELPKTWVRVREALEDDPRNYISLDEYLTICEQSGITDRTFKLQLSEYLHDLGVCLHFQDDPLLKKTMILKPEWGTDAVYMVLDNKEVICKLGKFTKADLTKIWHEEKYENMQDELLQLMMKFQLCYKIPGSSDTYIAPQLLSENQPRYKWSEKRNLLLRYSYDFMPKGLLTRFIVTMHKLIYKQKFVWKSGVILKKDETYAEVVEYYGKREIKIRIAGKYKKEFLTIVTHELDKIHDSFNRLKYDKLIPCNCSTCKDSQDRHFYAFDVLREFVADDQQAIQCQKKPYIMVNVLGLIDDVIDIGQFFRQSPDFAAQEERKTSFRWLHLTDLHRGMKEQHWLWPGVREIFFEDLQKLHDKCGPWDLVLFSGDLTQCGSQEEFQNVNTLLKELWEHFDKLGSSPVFLAVPGNHDLVRPKRESPSLKLLQQWADQLDVQEKFWGKASSSYRKVVMRAFKHYKTWWEEQPFRVKDVKPGLLPGDFSATIKKDGAKLGILGLNSAFLQLTDADYNGKLALHARQFQAACGGDGPAWAKRHHACLLLTHHPPKWLDPASQQHLKGEIMSHGRFAVHLCGHLHEAASRETSEGGTEFRRIWQGRSLFGLEYFGQKSQRLHGYTAGTIEIGRTTGRLFFWPREARLQGSQRSIVPDHSVKLIDDQHTPPREFELLQTYEPRVDEG